MSKPKKGVGLLFMLLVDGSLFFILLFAFTVSKHAFCVHVVSFSVDICSCMVLWFS